MDGRIQKHRMLRWMGRLLVVGCFGASSGAHAALDPVQPIWLWCVGTVDCVYTTDMEAANALMEYSLRQYANILAHPTPANSNSGYLSDASCDGNGRCHAVLIYPLFSTPTNFTLNHIPTCPKPATYPTIPYQYIPGVSSVPGLDCIRSIPSTLSITLTGGTEVEPSNGSDIKTLPIVATVKQSNGQPPSSPVKVRVSLKVEDPTSGGHDHGDSTRPGGGIADVKECASDSECWSKKTDGNGIVEFDFNAPEASGKYTIAATCDGCSSSSDPKTVEVKVDGLKPIPAFPFYALNEANGDVIGAKAGWHTDNHNLTPAAASVLAKIAVNYRFNPKFYLRDSATNTVYFPPLLHLNDASLPWGGVYDICARPDACAETGVIAWHRPHAEHRRGTVIDVRANQSDGAIPMLNKAKFKNYLVRLGLPYLHENQGTTNEHFHIRLMGRKE